MQEIDTTQSPVSFDQLRIDVSRIISYDFFLLSNPMPIAFLYALPSLPVSNAAAGSNSCLMAEAAAPTPRSSNATADAGGATQQPAGEPAEALPAEPVKARSWADRLKQTVS